MAENNYLKSILWASIIAGVLQAVYNTFTYFESGNIAMVTLSKLAPFLFEGTFTFILFSLIFISLKRDLFKEWILFTLVSAVILTSFQMFNYGFVLSNFISLFIFRTLAVGFSIKITDYLIRK